MKTLDQKLSRLKADPSANAFILADAKDADMAFGMAAPGQSPEQHGHEGRFRSLQEYRELIRANVRQGLVDIMLMSASTNAVLSVEERLFADSPITPAIRANDTTDVWLATGGRYAAEPSRPFRSASLDMAMCGKPSCAPGEAMVGADLGLYSITLNNDIERDHQTLSAYRDFRREAASKKFRHFLEVFDPNACGDNCPDDLPRFINDQIARTLAGAAGDERPVFLKIVYHGPAAMEQLCAYDRSVVVGILGGSSGTTFDAFHQLWEARRYGARAALYGRMINHSEHQPSFIQHLRWLADGELDDPAEAVRSYHGALQSAGVKPYRDLRDDLQPTSRASAYQGGSSATNPAAARPQETASDEQPDFGSMSAAEKVQWNLKRWDRILDGRRAE